MQDCVIIANCQGDILTYALKKHPDFPKDWNIHYFANFLKPEIPEGLLENCGLLLYQKLGDGFGDISEESLLKKINPKAKKIAIPAMINFHLWPTAKWDVEYGPIWRDTYFDEVIQKNLSLEETVYVIMKTDYAKIFDLESMMKNSLQIEYNKNYAWRTEILSFVEQTWKSKQIFTTPSHPANELIEFISNLILQDLGYKHMKFLRNFPLLCDRQYFLPIHPFFKKYYNVKWMHDEMLFPVLKNSLNYIEFVSTYVKAIKNNVPIFYAFNIWEKE